MTEVKLTDIKGPKYRVFADTAIGPRNDDRRERRYEAGRPAGRVTGILERYNYCTERGVSSIPISIISYARGACRFLSGQYWVIFPSLCGVSVF